jgi:hypothetical protein
MLCRRANLPGGTYFFTINVHYSPVKQSWVSRSVDWLHSTLHHHVRQDLLPPD